MHSYREVAPTTCCRGASTETSVEAQEAAHHARNLTAASCALRARTTSGPATRKTVRRNGDCSTMKCDMRRFCATLLAFAAAARLAVAEIPDTDLPWTNVPTAAAPAPNPTSPAASAKPAAKSPHPPAGGQSQAQLQAALDQLTQTNHELLDLLKKQQAVLEDMQFDRRLQSRQIAALEDRLEEALADKAPARAESGQPRSPGRRAPRRASSNLASRKRRQHRRLGSNPPAAVLPPSAAPISTPIVESVTPSATNAPPVADTPPPVPESYLPPPGADGPPGAQSWHRLFTLKGTDNKQTDVFLVHGKNWRVLWHNQDKPGKLYANTSALFINAFPRDDTIRSRSAPSWAPRRFHRAPRPRLLLSQDRGLRRQLGTRRRRLSLGAPRRPCAGHRDDPQSSRRRAWVAAARWAAVAGDRNPAGFCNRNPPRARRPRLQRRSKNQVAGRQLVAAARWRRARWRSKPHLRPLQKSDSGSSKPEACRSRSRW